MQPDWKIKRNEAIGNRMDVVSGGSDIIEITEGRKRIIMNYLRTLENKSS